MSSALNPAPVPYNEVPPPYNKALLKNDPAIVEPHSANDISQKISQENANTMLETAVNTNSLQHAITALNARAQKSQSSTLHLAAEESSPAIVASLLDNNACINSTHSRWFDTPINRAALTGNNSVVQLLIEQKANMEARNNCSGSNALELAVEFNRFDVCESLIKAKAEVNNLNMWGSRKGSTPLSKACKEGNYKITKLLLDNKANPNMQEFRSPLYSAAGDPEILRLLLKKGADLDYISRNEGDCLAETALHEAASCGFLSSVEVLLEHGANPKAVNLDGEVPLDSVKSSLKYHTSKPQDTSAKHIERLKTIIQKLENL